MLLHVYIEQFLKSIIYFMESLPEIIYFNNTPPPWKLNCEYSEIKVTSRGWERTIPPEDKLSHVPNTAKDTSFLYKSIAGYKEICLQLKHAY